MTRVTTRIVITQHGNEYNWHVTHTLGAYQVNGPGTYPTPEAAMEAAPCVDGWEYVIPECVNAASPLLH